MTDRRSGDERRDDGMERSENNPDNAAAVAAARQVLEVLIKTRPLFEAGDIIRAVEAQGIVPDKWQCIGGMLASASRKRRIAPYQITKASRPSRNSGDQKVWRSLEYEEPMGSD